MKRILCMILCGLLLVGFLSFTVPTTEVSGDLPEQRVAKKGVEEPHELTKKNALERGLGLSNEMSCTGQPFLYPPTEFVVVGGDDGVLYHFSSYGNGTFGPMAEIGNASDEGVAISYVDFANIAIADFDNDNDLDFVAGAGGGRNRLYLFTNDGSGRFNRTMIFEQICYCIKFYQDFATADFDGDGYYDFVTSSSPHGYIYVFINNQNQTFTLKSMIDEICFEGVSAGIDSGDFDEDGKMDFLVADYGYERETQQAHLYLGNGNGTFKLRKDAIVLSGIVPGGNGELWAVTTGDFNNDGHLDTIVGQDDDYDPGQTYLFIGDGTGNFSYYGEAYDLYPSIESGEDLEGIGYIDAFDFDRDGNLDVVCADQGSATQYTGKFWFVKGNGDGTFQTPILIYDFGDFTPVMGISAPPYQAERGLPPVADAGPDQTVYVGGLVQFDGSGSYDPDEGWQTTTVDSDDAFGQSASIALDSNDNPHMSYYDYTNQDLKYAKWTGNNWNIETVDSSLDVGWYNSIALDSSDNPHISYYDWVNEDLKCAGWTGSSWNIETVDSVGIVGEWTSIGIDSNDNPHISYLDRTNKNLKHAKWTGSIWSIEEADGSGSVGFSTSIAIDSNDNPHISYQEEFNDDLKYAKWTGTDWSIETVVSQGCSYNSIALDSNDNPHITFNAGGYVKYAKWTGTDWDIETVDPAGEVFWNVPMALDSDDNPYIAYMVYPGRELKYARWTGNEWSIESVDSNIDNSAFISIALDSDDNPHISYFDWTDWHLKYAKKMSGIISYDWDFGDGSPHGSGVKTTHVYNNPGVYNVTLTVTNVKGAMATDSCKITVLLRNQQPVADAGPDQTVNEGDVVNFDGSGSIGGGGGVWDIQTVDSYGTVGTVTSMAVDSSDNPHISYLDFTNDYLKYAKWTGSTWSIETVDSSRRVIHYNSMALDSSDNPHMSYYDATNDDLMHAKWTGSAWYIETVDSSGCVGWDPSIALDSSDNPHISYYDSTNSDLKYARWTGTLWNIETVDSNGTVGWYTSLALDSNDNPHISYTGDFHLKYAKWTNNAWNIETIDPADPVGGYTSIALDSNNNPHISYYDFTGDLKYAKWTGGAWNIETVDHDDAVGAYTSIALDTSDNPHISYYDWTNANLKYAKWTGSQWDIETVDGVDAVGGFTSITIDSSDYPHISYCDSTNSDLKYAKWRGEATQAQIVSYEWDFNSDIDSNGDGNTSNDIDATGPTPTHVYGDNGIYTVILTVTNDQGLSDTDTILVTVDNIAPIIVNLEAYIHVDFTLRVAGEKWHNVEIYIYEDGEEIAYGEVIRYPGSPDDQSVTITNVKCDVTKTITINVLYTPDDDPVNGQTKGANPCWVNITFEDGSYELLYNTFKVNHPETWVWNIEFNQYLVGHEITYIAEATDPGSDDLTFTWEWGDGTPDTETTYYNDGLGSDPYPSPWGTFPFNITDVKKHIYAEAGNYIATLTVTDDDGGFESDFATATIDNIIPIAHAGGPYFGNEGEVITYIGTQTAPCTSGFFLYYWDFGDGGGSNKQDPTHTYTIYGKYTVRLIVTNEYGDTDADICDVYVNANPIAKAGSDQTVYEGDVVQFDGGGSYDLDGSIISYEWDFDADVDLDGDGNHINDADAIGPSVRHAYDIEGEYRVTLTVTDGFSIGMTTLKITVLPNAPAIEDEEPDQEEFFDVNIGDFENEQDVTSEVSGDLNEDNKKDLEPIVIEDLGSQNPRVDKDLVGNDETDDSSVNPDVFSSGNPNDEDKPDFPLYTISVSICSVIISTLSLSLPLYMKINRKDLLKNRKRKLIYKYISTNPGDNFNGIKQALNLPNGVLTYHLKILEREDFITSKRASGYKRYYRKGQSNNIIILNGFQKDIINIIMAQPGISQTEIAEKIGTTVQVVNYHIRKLHNEGLVKIQMANGHRSQCFINNQEAVNPT